MLPQLLLKGKRQKEWGHFAGSASMKLSLLVWLSTQT
jgi:hypothetical protein